MVGEHKKYKNYSRTGNSQKMTELVKDVITRNNLSWGHVLPNWGAIVVNEGKDSDE